MTILDLNGVLAALKAIADVVSGVPGQLTQQEDSSWVYPQIGTGTITDATGTTVATGTNPQARITVEIIGLNGLGYDEHRRHYDPAIRPAGDTYAGPGAPLGSIVEGVTGQRELVVQFKCECYDESGAGSHVFIERIRTRLRLPSVQATLNAAGAALQKCGPSYPADYDDENGRRVDGEVLEVRFNTADYAADDPVTTIETVPLGAIAPA